MLRETAPRLAIRMASCRLDPTASAGSSSKLVGPARSCPGSAMLGSGAFAGTHLERDRPAMPGLVPPANTDELASLRDQLTRLEALARRRGRTIRLLGISMAVLLAFGVLAGHGLREARRTLAACRTSVDPSKHTLTALASAHEDARIDGGSSGQRGAHHVTIGSPN